MTKEHQHRSGIGRDELMFGSGAVTAVAVGALLEYVEFPWWTNLVTLPLAIWWVARIALGWRDELREEERR